MYHKIANPNPFRTELIHVLLLFLLCLTVFFFRLGARPLWDIDEGMHASTSKDMVLTGDWVQPTMNGQPFYDKPVLFNWLVAVSFLALGFTEIAARLPAALLGLGGVFVTYLLGKKMFDRTAALMGAAVLATSPEFIVLSRVVVHDIALLFFITLALFFFYMGFSDEGNRKRYFVLFYAASGFAVLAKGPIGLLLPGMIIGVFVSLRRRFDLVREMINGWGILVFFAVSSPWYIFVIARDPEYAKYFFIQQNLGSFYSEEVRHARPFYYYFSVLMGGFFPWSCFLPLATARAFQWPLRKMDTNRLFLLVWAALIFGFFSIAKSKLSTYILPLFPATSLLVGVTWRDLFRGASGGVQKAWATSFVPPLVLFPSAFLFLWIHPPAELTSLMGIGPAKISLLLLLLTAFAVSSFYFACRRRYAGSFICTLGGIVLGMVCLLLWVIPPINPYRSTKGLSLLMDRTLPPGQNMVFYRTLRDSSLFYTNRRATLLKTPAQLRKHLASRRRTFCVLEKKSLENLKGIPYVVVGREGDKFLISNQGALGRENPSFPPHLQERHGQD